MPDPTPTPDSNSTPPWGDDFDAARAWALIQNLRGEKADLQTKLDAAKTETTTERQARETAEKALSDADVEGRVKAAETRATAAERSLYTERAIRKFGLDDETAEFLTGETEEEITTRAEKLAKALGKKAPEGDPKPEDEHKPEGTPPPGLPTPDLQPGHAPAGGGSSFDPVAIAKQARSGH